MDMKIHKPGINKDIICKNCGKNLGRITVKKRVKWETIYWGIGLGLAFEIVANAVVYLVFR